MPSMPSSPQTLLLAAAAASALLAGLLSPAWAGEDGGGDAATSVIGGFGLGDRAEGLVDERDGALQLMVPVGGLSLSWDSRAIASDPVGFGRGWSAGTGHVDTKGGVRVFPASGGAFPLDESSPSGLGGYPLEDLKFVAEERTLEPRADGEVDARPASFVLTELGGTTSYFDADGRPLATIGAWGERTDWIYADDQLTTIVSATGVATHLEWDPSGEVLVRTAVGERDGGDWRLRRDTQGRIVEVHDPMGGVTRVRYDGADLITSVAGTSGAETEVAWQELGDGVPRVERVRVVDEATREELSVRTWEPGAGVASGWPALQTPTGPFGPPGSAFSTIVTDGSTRVISEYNPRHLLTGRSVEAQTSVGTVVLQELEFGYHDAVERGTGELPRAFQRPISTTTVYRDESGASREETVAYVYDDLGRVVEQTAPDGTVTTTTFDDELPPNGEVAVGLPLNTRVTAPDGLVTEQRVQLDETRRAAVATETFTGHVDGELTRTSRTEQDFADDGFVHTERVFAQGGGGTPIVATRQKQTDLTAGTMTIATTIAADTDVATTTTEVTDLLTGQPASTTDPLGLTTTFEYDQLGRPVAEAMPGDRVTRAEYRTAQQHGANQTIVTGIDGVTITEEVDALGRVIRVTDDIDRGKTRPGHERVVETRAYPDPGTVRVTDAWGATTSTRQDAFGRAVESVTADGLVQVQRYDDVANTVTTALTPTGDLGDAEMTSTSARDARGLVTETTGARVDGEPVLPLSAEFDGLGRQTSATDGQTTAEYTFDPLGNLATTTTTSVADGAEIGAAGGPLTVSREFDDYGRSVAKTISAEGESGSGRDRTYDELGRTVSEKDQSGLVSRFDYTADGLVERVTTGYGAVTTNTYDPTTRALTQTQTVSPIGETVTTAYDAHPGTGEVRGVYDPADRDATEIRYETDAWGNPTLTSYPDGTVIEHEYDANGRLERTIDGADAETLYTYDDAGRPSTVRQTDAKQGELAAVSYEYDDFSRLTVLMRGNGVKTAYTYTSAGQIATETTSGADGATQSERTYAYDADGNVTERTDRTAPPEGGTSEVITTAYAYNPQQRLIASTTHAGDSTAATTTSRTEYTIGVSGDIVGERVTAAPGTPDAQTTSRAFTYAATGELTEVATTSPDGTTTAAPQTYDDAGNLTLALDGTRYAYNALNQQIAEITPDGAQIATEYWASGARARLSDEAGSTTEFYWDGGELVNERHAADGGAPQAVSYLFGAVRHARSTAGGTSYFDQDRHGSVVATSDGAGALTAAYAYSDYGVQLTPDAEQGVNVGVGDIDHQPYRYAGEYTDHRGRAHPAIRVYDAHTMRFTSEDPADPFNKYAYANLNPITNVDPSGRTAIPDHLGFGLALSGLVLSLAGVALAVSAVFTGGASFIAFGAVAAATYDATVTGLTVADDFFVNIMSNETSAILGGVALAVGVVTAVSAGLDGLNDARKAASRVYRKHYDPNYLNHGPSDRQRMLVQTFQIPMPLNLTTKQGHEALNGLLKEHGLSKYAKTQMDFINDKYRMDTGAFLMFREGGRLAKTIYRMYQYINMRSFNPLKLVSNHGLVFARKKALVALPEDVVDHIGSFLGYSKVSAPKESLRRPALAELMADANVEEVVDIQDFLRYYGHKELGQSAETFTEEVGNLRLHNMQADHWQQVRNPAGAADADAVD